MPGGISSGSINKNKQTKTTNSEASLHAPAMKKKRRINIGTTDFSSDQSTTIRQFTGFWLLLKITETIYINAKKVNTVKTSCKPAVPVLIEPAFVRITWRAGQEGEKSYPFDKQRNRLLTNEILGGHSIRAITELTGNIMYWRFVVNYTTEHYSQFCYEFKRDAE
jgi:hypothetical protein